MHQYKISGDKSLVNEKITIAIKEGGYRIFHDYELSLDNEFSEMLNDEYDVRIEFHTEGSCTAFIEKLTVDGHEMFRFNDDVSKNDSVRYLLHIDLADLIEERDGLLVADDLPLEISADTRIGLVDTNEIKKIFPDTVEYYYTPFYVDNLDCIVFEERYQSTNCRVFDRAHVALCKLIMEEGAKCSQVIYK